jgi:DNA-binding MarR family transcriptional regulator
VSTILTETTAARPAMEAFTRLLRAHAATMRGIGATLLAEHGLSLNDYEALYLLSRAEGRRLKRVELARRLGLTPSGVTRLLEGLEEAGLVERAECPNDLRIAYALLTEAGARALRTASCDHEGSITALLGEHLSAAEIVQLAELLGRLPGVTDDSDACPQ